VIRWTVGAVSDPGYEALRLSIFGAARIFGPRERFVVCVNTVDIATVQRAVGELPVRIHWRRVTTCDIPAFIRERLDDTLAEGVGWKFAPLQLGTGSFEIALDNDCILWRMPGAIRSWLTAGTQPLVSEDVRACFGSFAHLCGTKPRNSGIRGLPPWWPYAVDLRRILLQHDAALTSELDEQGLQVAALHRRGSPAVVPTDDVTICSPFHPLQPHLGRCGAHFVGLNAKQFSWSYYGRPAIDIRREHWRELRNEVARRVGDRYS